MLRLLFLISGKVASRVSSVAAPVAKLTDKDTANDGEAMISLFDLSASIASEVVGDETRVQQEDVDQFALGLSLMLAVLWKWGRRDFDGDGKPDPKRVTVRTAKTNAGRMARASLL